MDEVYPTRARAFISLKFYLKILLFSLLLLNGFEENKFDQLSTDNFSCFFVTNFSLFRFAFAVFIITWDEFLFDFDKAIVVLELADTYAAQ